MQASGSNPGQPNQVQAHYQNSSQTAPTYTEKERGKFNKYAAALGNLEGHTVNVDGKAMPVAEAVDRMYNAYTKLAVNAGLSTEEKGLMANRLKSLKDSKAGLSIKVQSIASRVRIYEWLSDELVRLDKIRRPDEPAVQIEGNKKKAPPPDREEIEVSDSDDIESSSISFEEKIEKKKKVQPEADITISSEKEKEKEKEDFPHS